MFAGILGVVDSASSPSEETKKRGPACYWHVHVENCTAAITLS